MELQPIYEDYITHLKEYNTHTNIYSKNAYAQLDTHIKDSLTLATIIGNQGCTLFDFGSGSGLPSVCIAIKNPNNQVYAIESKSRKTRFLDLIKTELNLNNFHVINQNINEFIHKTPLKPSIITAKAFGSPEKIIAFAKKIKSNCPKIYIPISARQAKTLTIEYPHSKVIEKNTFLYLVFDRY